MPTNTQEKINAARAQSLEKIKSLKEVASGFFVPYESFAVFGASWLAPVIAFTTNAFFLIVNACKSLIEFLRALKAACFGHTEKPTDFLRLSMTYLGLSFLNLVSAIVLTTLFTLQLFTRPLASLCSTIFSSKPETPEEPRIIPVYV